MSWRQVVAWWRRGFRALAVFLMTFLVIDMLYAAVDAALPEIVWLKVAVATSLLFLVGPFLALLVLQFAYRSKEARKLLPTVTVGTFSDEPSAHIAASVLDRSGISSVVSSGSIGSQSGLAVPAGGILLLVSILDRARAELALAAAHESSGRQ